MAAKRRKKKLGAKRNSRIAAPQTSAQTWGVLDAAKSEPGRKRRLRALESVADAWRAMGLPKRHAAWAILHDAIDANS